MNCAKIPQACRKVYRATGGNADLDLCDLCPGPCYKGEVGQGRIPTPPFQVRDVLEVTRRSKRGEETSRCIVTSIERRENDREYGGRYGGFWYFGHRPAPENDARHTYGFGYGKIHDRPTPYGIVSWRVVDRIHAVEVTPIGLRLYRNPAYDQMHDPVPDPDNGWRAPSPDDAL